MAARVSSPEDAGGILRLCDQSRLNFTLYPAYKTRDYRDGPLACGKGEKSGRCAQIGRAPIRDDPRRRASSQDQGNGQGAVRYRAGYGASRFRRGHNGGARLIQNHAQRGCVRGSAGWPSNGATA